MKERHVDLENRDQLHEIVAAPDTFLAALYGCRAVVVPRRTIRRWGVLREGLRAVAWGAGRRGGGCCAYSAAPVGGSSGTPSARAF